MNSAQPIRSLGLDVSDSDPVPAPESGILLGQRRGKPVTLRLFRPQGTRIVVLGHQRGPQLVALRAAGLGARVEVATANRQHWQAIGTVSRDLTIAAHGALLPSIGSPFRPILTVDDRAGESAPAGDAASWQCRMDLRAIPEPSGLAQYGGTDLLLIGQLPLSVASTLVQLYHLDPAMDSALAAMPVDGIAAIRKGSVQLMSVAETAAETATLGRQSAPSPVVSTRQRSTVTSEADPRTVPPWAVRELAAMREAALASTPAVSRSAPARPPIQPVTASSSTSQSYASQSMSQWPNPGQGSGAQPTVAQPQSGQNGAATPNTLTQPPSFSTGAVVAGASPQSGEPQAAEEDFEDRTVPRWAIEEMRKKAGGSNTQ
jgi:hypothetical protein